MSNFTALKKHAYSLVQKNILAFVSDSSFYSNI